MSRFSRRPIIGLSVALEETIFIFDYNLTAGSASHIFYF